MSFPLHVIYNLNLRAKFEIIGMRSKSFDRNILFLFTSTGKIDNRKPKEMKI